MGRLRILHISDLHERATRETENWRRRRVLGDAWLKNLDDIAAEGAPDLVLFTGDAADRGLAAEYEGATEFLSTSLDRLGLKPDRLFVIPGNHDVNRSVSPGAWSEVRKTLEANVDLLGAARWMSGGPEPPGMARGQREELAKRLENYNEWVRTALKRPELTPKEGCLGYRATVNLPEFECPVQVIGLNTAWLCGDDNDAGRLWIFDEQLMRLATTEAGKRLPGLRLLLMHHPFEQMADGAACRRLLDGHIDLVLRGHLHEEEIGARTDPDRTVRELAVGCLYEGARADRWPNSCHVISLDCDAAGRPRKIEVRFRSWSARSGRWNDDNSLYRGSVNGRISVVVPAEPPGLADVLDAADELLMHVDPWSPAVPPVFVGREMLLRRLGAAWDEGRSVSLVGDWRIGKSSILATCYRNIEHSGRPVKLLNGEANEGSSPAAFVKAVTGMAVSAEVDSAADALAAWARQSARPGLLPLLLVDECDALVRRFEYRFFERLRGMLDNLCLGVSSRRELDRVFQDAGRGASPFQNRLELHWVGLLEPGAAEALIEKSAAAMPVPARKRIHEWAGRHPFFIQLMARKMADARKFGQTEDQAHEEFLIEASARLRELWSTLTTRDQQVLLEAANLPKPAARVLRARGLLDEDGRHFGRVLTQWLADEAS
jgi:predicted MPP superfamily phosphohydrolase